MTLTVPVAGVGSSTAFHEVAGLITFTPASSGPGTHAGATLRVPYYLVPRALSDVSTTIGTLAGNNPSTTAKVTNKNGAIAGDADFYAWGLEDAKDPGQVSNDVPRHRGAVVPVRCDHADAGVRGQHVRSLVECVDATSSTSMSTWTATASTTTSSSAPIPAR